MVKKLEVTGIVHEALESGYTVAFGYDDPAREKNDTNRHYYDIGMVLGQLILPELQEKGRGQRHVKITVEFEE